MFMNIKTFCESGNEMPLVEGSKIMVFQILFYPNGKCITLIFKAMHIGQG